MIHARSDYTERIQDSAGLIPDDEPVSLIRAALIASVKAHERRIVEWQAAHGSRVPDAPAEVLGNG